MPPIWNATPTIQYLVTRKYSILTLIFLSYRPNVLLPRATHRKQRHTTACQIAPRVILPLSPPRSTSYHPVHVSLLAQPVMAPNIMSLLPASESAFLRTGKSNDRVSECQLNAASRDVVKAATHRVSQAIFKSYRLREDAENAYNRALARNAVRHYTHPDEAPRGKYF